MARKGRPLSPEDREVWDRVARSAKPLEGRKPLARPAPSAKPAPSHKPAETAGPRPLDPFRVGEAAPDPGERHRLAPDVGRRVNEAPVRMHHGTHQKMVRGKLKPEARIDLHGMTLADAHPRLTRFILDAHARGLRLVLVITGKGRDRDEGGPMPVRRGVLRHQVPGWLHAPPLGALVLDIRTAHFRHGGEGAYYVYLRRGR